jgi:lysophospholipase L1-like esterase
VRPQSIKDWFVLAIQGGLILAAVWVLSQAARRLLGIDTVPGLTLERITMLLVATLLLGVAYGLRSGGWSRRSLSAYSLGWRERPFLQALWSVPAMLVVLVVLADVATRFFIGFQGPEIVQSQPYFGFGHMGSYSELWNSEGPPAVGYRKTGGRYVYDVSQTVRSFSDRGAFLFEERAERASRQEPDALRVFVVGSSTAYGWGASSVDQRWWVPLEKALTRELGREVVILNAAVPGYVSTQDRVVLDYAVLPRKPDAVVILNGINDLQMPIFYGVRPGDPYIQSVLYRANDSLPYEALRRLGRSSYLAFILFQRLTLPAGGTYPELARDPVLRSALMDSIASLYIDNSRQMLARCEVEQVACLIVLQPTLPVTRNRLGLEPSDTDWEYAKTAASFYIEAYAEILRRARGLGEPNRFHDATQGFDGAIAGYKDWMHFTDDGQVQLAEYMQPVISRLLRQTPKFGAAG